MDRSITSGVLLGVVLILAAALPPAQPSAQEDLGIVPGEVIVKLVPDSTGGRALAQADRDQLQEDPGLAEFLLDLSREAGVSLGIDRLTSGGELVLVVDPGKLRDELLHRLRNDQQIENARTREVSEGTCLAEADIEVVVNFKRVSSAAATVRRLNEDGQEGSPGIQALGAELVGIPNHKPIVRISGDAELSLVIDLRQLINDLVAWLHTRPDVEYAQPNRLLHSLSDSFSSR